MEKTEVGAKRPHRNIRVKELPEDFTVPAKKKKANRPEKKNPSSLTENRDAVPSSKCVGLMCNSLVVVRSFYFCTTSDYYFQIVIKKLWEKRKGNP